MQRLIIAAGEAWDQTGYEGIDCVPTRKTWKNNSYFSQTSRVLLIPKGKKRKKAVHNLTRLLSVADRFYRLRLS
jgi:hypothetical protein